MKYIAYLLSLLTFTVCAYAGDDFIVPDGIRYNKASHEVNDKAKKLLKNLFVKNASDEVVFATIFENSLICGPGLWQDIKNNKVMANINDSKVVLDIPIFNDDGTLKRTYKLDGKIFRSPAEILSFWNVFSKMIDFSNLKIRKLNQEELKIYWTMISWDITEPIFILESENHKILAVFLAPDNLKIAWIDDYQEVSITKQNTHNKPKSADVKSRVAD